jgi:hypothetical protein
LNKS